ncbi:MAG: polyphosphate polymerase domain-containing protein [Clostridiales bacterium]|nr:polyphosphate polymerase domain-containing protein [Clostridiales bacterium]
MAIEVFNRHEQKYLLDADTFQKVIEVMDEYMMPDKYNVNHKPYTISNIYFDTEDDYLIRTSLSKPNYKEKLRLRSYGVPTNDSQVFLEIKKKFNDIVNKRRTVLKLSEAYNFISSGKPPELKEYMNTQVLKEIEYFLQVYRLKPKVYLAYDRIAYFEKDNNDLRISFDKNIRTRRYDVALEDGDYGEALLPDGVYLMEVKTSKAMPLWLTDMLAKYDIKRRSFSKYGTEFIHQLQMAM